MNGNSSFNILSDILVYIGAGAALQPQYATWRLHRRGARSRPEESL